MLHQEAAALKAADLFPNATEPAMFELGKEYMRADVQRFVGGRMSNTAILYSTGQPPLRPRVVVCVCPTRGGRFNNAPEGDGGWFFYGQSGRAGNPLASEGNRQVRDSSTVLFFTARPPTAAEARMNGGKDQILRFEGTFHVAKHEMIQPRADESALPPQLRFHLRPCKDPNCEACSGLGLPGEA